MTQLKELAIKTIENLPDSCTIDDIMYEINFVNQVMEGIKDADEKKYISTDELLQKVKEWQK
ncbi:MAG: hypothetical protein K1X86_03380 [Ignavibacteria bacterium]|nr:hypothetical protein [Ignavibacteria bacterium]